MVRVVFQTGYLLEDRRHTVLLSQALCNVTLTSQLSSSGDIKKLPTSIQSFVKFGLFEWPQR